MRFDPNSGGNVSWRCINRAVYACFNGGGSGPCELLDARRTTNSDVHACCRENPNLPYLPAALVGHYTIYDWGCVAGRPRVVGGPNAHPDPQGFRRSEWVRVAQ
jgi:hypothetical protein